MISWCSASAVRFIGTQRPSIAIENDVSTSSATAAWVRASVSVTSTSRTSRRTPWRGSPPSPAVRTTALVMVRVTSHGSVSPNAHARLAPLARRPRRRGGGRAAPGGRTSGWRRPEQRLAELAHRLRRQPELAVGAALEVAGVAAAPAPARPGSGRRRRPASPSWRAELVEVDVVQPGAAVGLGELLGQVVEVGQVLQHAGAVAEPEPLLAVEVARSRPSPRRAAAPAGWRRAGRATASARGCRTPAAASASARRAAPGSSSCASAGRRPRAGRARRSARRCSAGSPGRSRRACP